MIPHGTCTQYTVGIRANERDMGLPFITCALAAALYPRALGSFITSSYYARARQRTSHRTRSVVQHAASPEPSSVAEAAFLDIITVEQGLDGASTEREALRIYRRHGIVRLPEYLTHTESKSLVQKAVALQRKPRKAFGQLSRADRETIWLAGPSDSRTEDGSGTNHTVFENGSVLARALDGDLAALWRSCVTSLGATHLGLAEVVTSMPGGRAQAWHQDGAGVTLQIALCDIGLAQGPTEIRPRAFTAENFIAATRRGRWRLLRGVASTLHKMQRPIYKRTTEMHSALFRLIGPRMSHEQMVVAMRLGVLPPPPLVRLTADMGTLMLYDAAMRHRGGANRGDSPRPILAVHMRAYEARRTPRTFLECYDS